MALHTPTSAMKPSRRRSANISCSISGARGEKRPRNPKVEVVMQHLSDADVAHREPAKTRHKPRAQSTCAKFCCQPLEGFVESPVFPFWSRNPLVMLERHWGMDMFSAYGIAFVMTEGANRRLRSNSKGLTGGGDFWFPFAFRALEFLRHFRETIISRSPAGKYIPCYCATALDWDDCVH
jgi:hypothetical protein